MQVAAFILNLFAVNDYAMVMDRTNRKFGKSDINILFLVIIIGKIFVPIYWQSLSHGGACSSEFMQEFLQKFINNFGVKKIKYLLADREFMNKSWLNFLLSNEINFAIPLKSDNKIRLTNTLRTVVIGKIFNQLKPLPPDVMYN
jgi:hypothetical protein